MLTTEATSEHVWRPHRVIGVGNLGSMLRNLMSSLGERLTWPLRAPPPSPTRYESWSPRSTLACSNDGLPVGRRVCG